MAAKKKARALTPPVAIFTKYGKRIPELVAVELWEVLKERGLYDRHGMPKRFTAVKAAQDALNKIPKQYRMWLEISETL